MVNEMIDGNTAALNEYEHREAMSDNDSSRFSEIKEQARILFSDALDGVKLERTVICHRETYNLDNISVAVFEDDEFPKACALQAKGNPKLMSELIRKHGLRLALQWIDDSVDYDDVF